MKVQELMTTPVASCTPETNLAATAMEMWRSDCGAVPVVADDGNVVGMITDRDICIAAATQHHDIAEIPVRAVISRPVASCAPEDDIEEALATMARQRVRRLPVVDGEGKLQGIVSINDLILRAERNGRSSPTGVSADHLIGVLQEISSHWLPVPVSVEEQKPANRGRRARAASK